MKYVARNHRWIGSPVVYPVYVPEKLGMKQAMAPIKVSIMQHKHRNKLKQHQPQSPRCRIYFKDSEFIHYPHKRGRDERNNEKRLPEMFGLKNFVFRLIFFNKKMRDGFVQDYEAEQDQYKNRTKSVVYEISKDRNKYRQFQYFWPK